MANGMEAIEELFLVRVGNRVKVTLESSPFDDEIFVLVMEDGRELASMVCDWAGDDDLDEIVQCVMREAQDQ